MKAREYFAVYAPRILSGNVLIGDAVNVIFEMFTALSRETITICESKNKTLGKDVAQVFIAQNRKWNALHQIFLRKCGMSPIVKDGFILYWRHRFSEDIIKQTEEDEE